MSHVPFWLSHRGCDHPLAIGTFSVGRQSTCDLVVNDPSVSREHARFEVHQDEVTVVDLSRNGIFLEGYRTRRASLSHGSRLRIGTEEFVLRKGDDAPRRRETIRPVLEDMVSFMGHDELSVFGLGEAVRLLLGSGQKDEAAQILRHTMRKVDARRRKGPVPNLDDLAWVIAEAAWQLEDPFPALWVADLYPARDQIPFGVAGLLGLHAERFPGPEAEPLRQRLKQ